MNLFLYIPPHSAHPPGVTKSIIYSLCQAYWLQNTLPSDYIKMVRLLRKRLMARGHRPSTIDPILKECYVLLKTKFPLRGSTFSVTNLQSSSYNDANPMSRLFFHLPFHPRDVSRAKIQEFYNKSCNNTDDNGESLETVAPTTKGIK